MLAKNKIQEFQHTAYEMKKDILYLAHKCGTQNAHLGGCLSAVDILNVLYTDVMNLTNSTVRKFEWENRDKFVMSKGHAGIAMYAALKQVGILTQEHFDKGIRGENTILFRHPKYNPDYAIECSVGSLGMGIGYAVGLAEIAIKKGSNAKIYVMLGDGECDEGAVWESLEYAAHRNLTNLYVIIDNNGLQLDGPTKDVLNLGNLSDKLSSFGYNTIEINGHDYDEIYDSLHILPTDRPIAIVAKTVKGYGLSFTTNKVEWHDNFLSDSLYLLGLEELEHSYSEEEKSFPINKQESYSPSIRDVSTYQKISINIDSEEIEKLAELGFKNVIGYISQKIAAANSRFILTYSDCANRIGINTLRAKYPEVCYEMGIAEQNQVAVSAAFAHNGYHVFSVAYAPFITARVLDQVRALLGYMKSPVKLIGLSAGFASSDLGATHTALEDIANLRAIPNMVVVCPADCLEIAKAMQAACSCPYPMYIRITAPIYGCPMVYVGDYSFEIGKAVTLRDGKDVAIVGCGSILSNALECAEKLASKDVDVKVINMHTIKPIDVVTLDSIKNYRLIVTIEEHSVIGGLGSAISEYYSQFGNHAPILKIGVPDTYYVADIPCNELKRAGLTTEQIVKQILKKLS